MHPGQWQSLDRVQLPPSPHAWVRLSWGTLLLTDVYGSIAGLNVHPPLSLCLTGTTPSRGLRPSVAMLRD